MKPPIALVLLAASSMAAAVSGCSSSPLAGTSEAGDVEGSAPEASAGSAAVGAAGPPAVDVTGPKATYAAYPPGPYGTGRGATIQNLSFLGWRHPDASGYDIKQFETVRLSDFYDPDGHTGVKLLAINASAVWCGVCRAEYQDMNTNGTYAAYKAKGVEILGTLFEDNAYYPAQPMDLSKWGSVANHDVKFPLALDPSFKMGAYFDSDATPLNLLVNVRTMTIVSITMGYSATYWNSVQTQLNKL